jgi:hypothetical protein
MEKMHLKAAHAIDNFIQAVLQLIQVADLRKEQQKMSMNCVEYISISPSTGQ